MPRKPEVDKHPKKKQIINSLIRGLTYREITGKFGVTKSSLSRYLREKLMPKAAKVKAERDLRDGAFVLDEISEVMKKVKKMLNACDEYLKDPEDPAKYYLGPRAEEIEVEYYLADEDGKNRPKYKDTLQNIIDQVRGLFIITSHRYKHADPRRLLLETARTLNIQLELLAKIQGQIKDVTINIINTPVWIQLQQIILEATKGKPEVRKQIADALNAIAEPGRSS